MSSLSSASMLPHRRLVYASAGGGYHDEPVVDCFKPCFPNCNISFCSTGSPPSPSLDSPSFPLPTVPGASPVNITFPLGDDGPHKDSGHLTLIALVVSSVLATFFLLITYYLLLHRCRSYLRRRRRRSTSITTRALAATGPFLDDDPSPDAAAAADLVQDGIHHVWYIRTVGLDEPTIGSITVCVYRKDEGLIDGTDCSVCLGEFCEGEFVRLLPKCSHAFHIPCIDTWLRAHVNCPLCRAPIVCSPSASAATAAPRGNLDLPNSDAAVGAVDASSSSDEDHRHQQHQPLQTMPVVPEEERVDADGPVIGIPVPSRPSSAVLDCGLRVQSDLRGYGGRHLGDDHWVTIELDADDDVLQPVRRSVSMDSSAMGALLRRVDLGGKDPAFGAEARGKEEENNPNGASPQKDPQGIGRCQSTNGGKFFLSRFTRGCSIPILPL